MIPASPASLKAVANVRFGSKADMCAAKRHVCFTPNSDRESEIPQQAMSALPPKADTCSATRDVRFGPKADMGLSNLVRFVFMPPTIRGALRGLFGTSIRRNDDEIVRPACLQ
jgi:hypothetical protein